MNTTFWGTFLPIAIALIALLVALFLWFKQQKQLAKIEKQVRKLLKKEQSNLTSNGSDYKALRNDIIKMQRKLGELEMQLTHTLMHHTSQPAPSATLLPKEPIAPAPIQQRLYAKINSNKYFPEVKSSKEETCVFVITLKSETEGEFEIISLEKIKQRNGWEPVVDYSGKCTINEAKHFSVDHKGRCIKMTNGMWMVIDNLKITLSK